MKKLITTSLLALLSFNSFANSAMIFPQRAILNESNKSASFKVINPLDKKTTYSISLVDRVQDNSGSTTLVENYDQSAKDFLRYTPRKKVTLDKNGKKPIRIKLSNFGALKDGEYRSYLNIVTKPNSPLQEGYSVQMRTGIQLPIIIRKGDLNAKLTLSSTPTSDKINVTLHREGNRSIHGDITIKQNNEQIGFAKSTAIYPEAQTAIYSIPVSNFNKSEPYNVEFIESKESGNITVSQLFTN